MSRLIDADALFKRITSTLDCVPIDVLGMIEGAPTIEAEPVRRGRWLPHPMEKDWRVCSACGQGTEIVRHEAGATTEFCYQHCPWCGARMEVEE